MNPEARPRLPCPPTRTPRPQKIDPNTTSPEDVLDRATPCTPPTRAPHENPTRLNARLDPGATTERPAQPPNARHSQRTVQHDRRTSGTERPAQPPNARHNHRTSGTTDCCQSWRCLTEAMSTTRPSRVVIAHGGTPSTSKWAGTDASPTSVRSRSTVMPP